MNIGNQNGLLERDAVRRLCRSIILSEQDNMLQVARISAEKAGRLRHPDLNDSALDALSIDEETLGFDSLSVLDLIMRFDQFFGLHETGIEDYFFVDRKVGSWVTLIQKHIEKIGATKLKLHFNTSGSTGEPKKVSHDFQSLVGEAQTLKKTLSFPLTNSARVLTLVPAHHIFGFIFTCLLPREIDRQTIELSGTIPSSAAGHAKPGDIVVGTPFHWAKIKESGRKFACGVVGIVSAAPMQKSTWSITESAGLSRLIEIYGSTETGGIGWRDRETSPFHLLPHLKKQGEHVWDQSGRTLELQDDLDWPDQKTFFVNGRKDGSVQVGGVNVSPTWVADQVRSFSGVADVAVRLDGQRLKAFIATDYAMPQEDTQGFEASLRKEINRCLPPHARPQSITFGTQLPMNSIGKLTDWH